VWFLNKEIEMNIKSRLFAITLAMAAIVSFDCSAKWGKSNKSVAAVKADADEDVARTESASTKANADAKADRDRKVARAKASRDQAIADEKAARTRDVTKDRTTGNVKSVRRVEQRRDVERTRSKDDRTIGEKFEDWKNRK
jgi:hypothetical protein